MLKRKDMEDNIIRGLAGLEVYIKLANEVQNYDINRYCEDFLAELLNLTYEIKLKNLNALQVNFPAIDLGDYQSRICYQITSTSDLKKIEYTIDKFIEHGLETDFDELNIFILGTKKKHTKTINRTEVKFDFNHNLFDFSTLIRDIQKIKNLERLEQIHKLVVESVNAYSPSTNIGNLDGGQPSDLLENIKMLLDEESVQNLIHLQNWVSKSAGVEFNIFGVFKIITEEGFEPGQFYYPFFRTMETEQYDKYEASLLTFPPKDVKAIILLYKQFKLINSLRDIRHFTRAQYAELREVLLLAAEKLFAVEIAFIKVKKEF